SVVELQQHTKNDQLVLRKRILDYFRDAMNLGVVIVEHIGLLVAPFYFTWNTFWVFWILAFLTNYLGISLCYHRNLSHKSFKLPNSLEYLFAYFGLHDADRCRIHRIYYLGDPISWVSTHRYHHQFTDSHRDPHSPIEGFWFIHITWLFQHTHLRKKAFFFFFFFFLHFYGDLLTGFCTSAGWKTKQCIGFAKTSILQVPSKNIPASYSWTCTCIVPHRRLTAPYLGNALSHHATFVVNSLCHTWGRRPWNTKDLSKNNWVVGLLGHGEGWHNNHHAFEFSARLGLECILGFATDVKVPTEIQKYKMSCKTRNKFHQNEKDF
ncbi:hypothetical protein MKX03_023684, partial [Papaver bracteatum]